MRRTYDPKRDGCPFAWILAEAQAEREARQGINDYIAQRHALARQASAARLQKAEAAMDRPKRLRLALRGERAMP